MENEKKRTVMADKKNKSKKIKYRKKKKPVAVKSLTALKAAQDLLEKSEPKHDIATSSADDHKCDFSEEFIEIIKRDLPLENALAIVNKKTSGTPSLGIENATNTVGPLTNNSRQAPSLSFWQRIMKFLGIRRSK